MLCKPVVSWFRGQEEEDCGRIWWAQAQCSYDVCVWAVEVTWPPPVCWCWVPEVEGWDGAEEVVACPGVLGLGHFISYPAQLGSQLDLISCGL